jgi:hypothetical protein
MKKVLIGLGIGCGVILLAGVGLMVAAGFWAKKNLGGTFEATQQIQAQEAELMTLNTSYPFDVPAQGALVALDEKRLETYLAVREEALPVFKTFEQKAEEFEQKYGEKNEGQAPDFSAAMAATNLMMGLVVEVRAAYIAGLKKHSMSPAEFQALTHTLQTSMVADGATPESSGLSEEALKVATANVALLRQNEARIGVLANAAFDSFILGGASLPGSGGLPDDSAVDGNAQDSE